MKQTAALKAATWIYDLIWLPAIPFLRRHRRLANGFEQRLVNPSPRPAEVWIQAASAGEAYIAVELANLIQKRAPASILLTTNTQQGLEILQNNPSAGAQPKNLQKMQSAYFPLDRPSIMKRAVNSVKPGVMVLIETELWPGHLLALKQSECRILLVNGRLTSRSLDRYRMWPNLWHRLSPDEILAVSSEDADRFKMLFPGSGIATMPNMKFDRVTRPVTAIPSGPVAELLPASSPFVVFGSVRKHEEQQVVKMMTALLEKVPGAVIGLFPRHMERLNAWRVMLDKAGLRWLSRSKQNRTAQPGSIILWDRFGELAGAYDAAEAAFIGGSLAARGGQNFLEPLQSGILPVIGPHWDNFHWVGSDIVSQGLLQVATDWQSAVGLLVQTVKQGRPRADIRLAAGKYIDTRRGGTRQACELVMKYLQQAAN